MVLLGAQFALNLINVFHPYREMVRNIKVNSPQGRTTFFTAKVLFVYRDAEINLYQASPQENKTNEIQIYSNKNLVIWNMPGLPCSGIL